MQIERKLLNITTNKNNVTAHTIATIENKSYRNKIMEVTIMSNKQTSNTNSVEVPQAKDALNKFKMEVASELGVNLKQGYNGDLTSAQAGSIGGEMVRKMIKRQEETMANQNK